VIDSHCHLADDAFQGDLDEVIARARGAGITEALCVLTIGEGAELSRVPRIVNTWPAVRFSVGIHPHVARAWTDQAVLDEEVGAAVTGAIGPVAVGEIGLDYHYDHSPREGQRQVFRRQLQLARHFGLPVVIHSREADADTLAILREERDGLPGGVFHCFSGDAALLDAALDLGFEVSFAGIVTFPKGRDLLALATRVPLDRILVETDCPYLAPVPHRGRRNEPAWVVEVAAAIADARGERLDIVEAAVTATFARLFGPNPVSAR
jgi:TatD DNase family protein